MAFAMFLQGQHLDLLQFDLIYAMKLKTVGRFPGFFPISYFLSHSLFLGGSYSSLTVRSLKKSFYLNT